MPMFLILLSLHFLHLRHLNLIFVSSLSYLYLHYIRVNQLCAGLRLYKEKLKNRESSAWYGCMIFLLTYCNITASFWNQCFYYFCVRNIIIQKQEGFQNGKRQGDIVYCYGDLPLWDDTGAQSRSAANHRCMDQIQIMRINILNAVWSMALRPQI